MVFPNKLKFTMYIVATPASPLANYAAITPFNTFLLPYPYGFETKYFPTSNYWNTGIKDVGNLAC